MNSMTKVLVVDNGERSAADLLSTELAEAGFSSVTTSLEAANDVLEVIARPSAIFINMPERRDIRQEASFARFVYVLRYGDKMAGIPVIEWRRSMAGTRGVSELLTAEIGAQAAGQPAGA